MHELTIFEPSRRHHSPSVGGGRPPRGRHEAKDDERKGCTSRARTCAAKSCTLVPFVTN